MMYLFWIHQIYVFMYLYTGVCIVWTFIFVIMFISFLPLLPSLLIVLFKACFFIIVFPYVYIRSMVDPEFKAKVYAETE